MADSKLENSGKLPDPIKASKSGDGGGPTGSSRSYPKGSAVDMKPDFNPQKHPGSTYGVNGV